MNDESRNVTIEKNYPFFGLASFIYAIFYTFCLYKNPAGIAFPFFTAGTLFYFGLCLKKLGVLAKKDSIFYLISIELLGISTFLTGDERIIFMNKIAIFFLLISFLLHVVYDDKKWNFGKYMGAVFSTIFMSFGRIYKPVSDLAAYIKLKKTNPELTEGKKNNKLQYVFFGILICVPLVIVVLILLISADAVVLDYVRRLFFGKNLFEVVIDVFCCCFLTVMMFFFSYMLISHLNQKTVSETVNDYRKGEPVIAITVAAILSVIYLVFSLVQIIYLFVGGVSGSMSLPEGMSYAMYARQGFFQLLFVCLLNLIIVLLGLSLFKESKILKAFMCIITFCTYIMIASSALRMIMYIQFKYLTFLRIFVLWSLLVIFLCLTGVVITIFNDRFPLFRYSMTVLTVLYLLLSFSHPDYFIAKVNTENMTAENQYEFFSETEPYADYDFLAYQISSDGAPVLITQDTIDTMGEKTEDGYWDFYERYGELYGEAHQAAVWDNVYAARMSGYEATIRTFNVSKYLAASKVPK